MGVLLSSSAVIDKTPRSLIISLSSLYLAVCRKSAKLVLLSAEVVCLYTQAIEVRVLVLIICCRSGGRTFQEQSLHACVSLCRFAQLVRNGYKQPLVCPFKNIHDCSSEVSFNNRLHAASPPIKQPRLHLLHPQRPQKTRIAHGKHHRCTLPPTSSSYQTASHHLNLPLSDLAQPFGEARVRITLVWSQPGRFS